MCVQQITRVTHAFSRLPELLVCSADYLGYSCVQQSIWVTHVFSRAPGLLMCSADSSAKATLRIAASESIEEISILLSIFYYSDDNLTLHTHYI